MFQLKFEAPDQPLESCELSGNLGANPRNPLQILSLPASGCPLKALPDAAFVTFGNALWVRRLASRFNLSSLT